ncbi:MAG: glycogen/starch synthase [Salibacter sp.]|uniref:glycogen/starch synthase n=1 Tax=Salibacter sp. TaxID=2010995 RepID=UPI00286FEF88|nr:glycogen/starch synthase [Salibacter sp.]MDR9397451.1 glycogen/starch synthase [Salibacter sp.]
MSKPRILFVSQEITPYLPENQMSGVGRNLPQGIQERGKEIRTFMPRFGVINERRHQLHEVIRLSGMNLVVNDFDHPLIIKVASIQPARMQVYFIDNEEFFHRKAIFEDKEGNFFEDNDERSIFFVRGVLETVKKLGWSPDIIHCHGWMTSLLPTYLKTVYKNDPLFNDTQVVYSVYDQHPDKKIDDEMINKVKFDGIEHDEISVIEKADYNNLHKLAVSHADAVIKGSENVDEGVEKAIKEADKPFLDYQDEESYIDAYSEFYDKILDEKSVLAD